MQPSRSSHGESLGTLTGDDLQYKPVSKYRVLTNYVRRNLLVGCVAWCAGDASRLQSKHGRPGERVDGALGIPRSPFCQGRDVMLPPPKQANSSKTHGPSTRS